MVLKPTFIDRTVEALQKDKFLRKVRNWVKAKNVKGFAVTDNGALTNEGKLCVLKDEELRKEILEEAHNTPYTSYPGGTKMHRDLKKIFLWRNMKGNTGSFLQRCMACQQVKVER